MYTGPVAHMWTHPLCEQVKECLQHRPRSGSRTINDLSISSDNNGSVTDQEKDVSFFRLKKTRFFLGKLEIKIENEIRPN